LPPICACAGNAISIASVAAAIAKVLIAVVSVSSPGQSYSASKPRQSRVTVAFQLINVIGKTRKPAARPVFLLWIALSWLG
jgi:hypothetical protein